MFCLSSKIKNIVRGLGITFLLILFTGLTVFSINILHAQLEEKPDSDKIYTVKKNDSLAKISFKVYTEKDRERGAHWIHIYEYSLNEGYINPKNQKIITKRKGKNINAYVRLIIGQKLAIPFYNNAYPSTDKLLRKYNIVIGTEIDDKDEVSSKTTDDDKENTIPKPQGKPPVKTDLIKAVSEGNIDKVKTLLEEGIDANDEDYTGNTTIHLAVGQGNLAITELLIEYGANIKAINKEGRTPLHLAIEERRYDIAELLIEKSKEQNTEEATLDLVNITDYEGISPLYIAVVKGDTEIIRMLIEKKAFLNIRDNSGWTPLHVTAKNNDDVVMKLLLESGADTNPTNDLGETPLMIALTESNFEISDMLIANKADITVQDNEGMNILHRALFNINDKALNYIFSELKDELDLIINVRDRDGETPFFYSVKYEHSNNTVKKMLKYGADSYIKNDMDTSPLKYALDEYGVGKALFLIDAGVEIDENSIELIRDIIYDNYKENTEFIKKIFDNGLNLNRKYNIYGRYLLLDMLWQNKDLATDMIRRGANPNIRDDIGNSTLFTILSVLIEMSWNEEYFLDFYKILIENGADVNIKKKLINDEDLNYYGSTINRTPLHQASFQNSLNTIELLLENSADHTTKSFAGALPLHELLNYPFYYEKNNDEFIEKYKKLIYKLADGIDINSQTNQYDNYYPGSTFLHQAVIIANDNDTLADYSIEFIEILLELGIDPSIKDYEGLTPFEIAYNDKVRTYLAQHSLKNNVKYEEDGTLLHQLVKNRYTDLESPIEIGFDVNATDKYNLTPLFYSTVLNDTENMDLLKDKGALLYPENYSPVYADNGNTPLHFAITNNNIEMVKELLTQNINYNAKDENGRTPLHIAILLGLNDIANILIDSGKADMNAVDYYGGTPLMYSEEYSIYDENPITQKLIDAGAEKYIEFTQPEGIRAYMPIHDFVYNSNFEGVEKIIQAGADVNSFTSMDVLYSGGLGADMDEGAYYSGSIEGMNTPLHLAVNTGDAEMVKLLLDNGADVNLQNNIGRTPLHLAVEYGDIEIIALLLDKDCETHQDIMGRTPLHIAIDLNDPVIVSKLVEHGIGINVANNNGVTPLVNLIIINQGEYTDLIKALLEKGADLNRESNILSIYWFDVTNYEFNWTPIFFAITNGNEEVIRMLIDAGADMNKYDNKGKTPIDYLYEYNKELAIEYNLIPKVSIHDIIADNDIESMKLYIKNENDLNLKNYNGEPLLHYSIRRKSKEISYLLIEAGADIESKTIYDETPLFPAVRINDIDMVKTLIGKGVDVNAVNSVGETPLYYAVAWGRLEIMDILIDAGADIDVKTSLGKGLLHTACWYGELDMAKRLVKMGLDVEEKDKFGKTPIFDASFMNREEIIKYLYEKGANLRAVDNYNRDILFYTSMLYWCDTANSLLKSLLGETE